MSRPLWRILVASACVLGWVASALAADPASLTFAFGKLRNPANFDGATPDPAAHYIDGKAYNYYDGRALRRGQVSGTIFVAKPGARLDAKPRTWTVRRERVAGRDVVLLQAADFKIELHGAVAPPAEVRQLLTKAFGKSVQFGP
ncbi:MAG: hypothetical protein JSR82_11425 [Verrucomicrobia bacterium]|nr:hypothetical protein [Verrucomicrobiota bacterium]